MAKICKRLKTSIRNIPYGQKNTENPSPDTGVPWSNLEGNLSQITQPSPEQKKGRL